MSERARKGWPILWFIVVLVLGLAMNVVFRFLLPSQGSGAIFGAVADSIAKSVYSITPLGEGEIAVATLGNDLFIQKDSEVLAQTTVPAAMFGVVYRPESEDLLVGASNARIYTYDRQLQQVGEVKIEGGVLGMAPLEGGQIAVGWGIGAFGDRFYVSILDASLSTLQTYQVGVRINAFTSLGGLAVYGTDQARVGAVGPDGQLQWEFTAQRQITALQGWPEQGQILVGDKLGNVYAVDEAGNLVWERNLGQFAIRALQPMGERMAAAGDDDGGLYLLDEQGELLIAQPTVNANDPVGAIYVTDKGLAVAVRQSGASFSIDTALLSRAQMAETLRPVWNALNALWAILLLVTLIGAIEPWRRAVAGLLRGMYRARAAYAFLLPSLILVTVWVYVAAIMAIYFSTTDYIPGDPIRFVGMANFIRIFTADRYFWTGFGNMILILVTSTIKVLTMPLAVALLVFHMRNPRAQYILRTAFLLPSVVPGIVLTMMWKMMYDPGGHGFINAILRVLGTPQLQRAWLGDERTAIWAIIFAGFPWVGAFAFLIYLGGLININTELFDAGAIDGVNWWKRLRYIEWPLIGAQRNLLLFFTYLGAIQAYEGIWVYTQGGPGHATYVPALQLYLNLSQGMRVGYASAIGFVLFLMVLGVTIINRRLQARSQMI